jgi:hypothetical protein
MIFIFKINSMYIIIKKKVREIDMVTKITDKNTSLRM